MRIFSLISTNTRSPTSSACSVRIRVACSTGARSRGATAAADHPLNPDSVGHRPLGNLPTWQIERPPIVSDDCRYLPEVFPWFMQFKQLSPAPRTHPSKR